MSGRYEAEQKINQKINNALSDMPKIFTDYYYNLIGSGLSYNTAYNYIFHCKKFVNATFNNVTPAWYKHCSSSDIAKFMAELRTKNGKRVSDSLLTGTWSALNNLFSWLHVNGYTTKNLMIGIPRPKQKDNPDVKYLDTSEIKEMLNIIKNNAVEKCVNRDLAIIHLMFETGLRKSELISIDISDIDFENKSIRIITKGDKYRTIFVGDNCIELIKSWLVDRDRLYDVGNIDALFVSSENKRLSPRSMNDLVNRYSPNGKHMTVHSIRHSTAMAVYEKSNDLYLTAEVLGHSNVQTSTRYAKVTEERRKNANSMLDSLL